MDSFRYRKEKEIKISGSNAMSGEISSGQCQHIADNAGTQAEFVDRGFVKEREVPKERPTSNLGKKR